jgi:ABC-2 type transport system ATP-binding protein
LRATDPTRTLHELTSWALANGVALDELTVTRPSLEDAYLELTGGRDVDVTADRVATEPVPAA